MGKLDEKAESLRFASLNVRGINNFRKRRSVFAWCKKQKVDLIFLQKTHSTENHESQWMKEWGSQIIFSHGSSDARRVAVLFKRGLDIKILNCNKDPEGRFIMLKAEIKEKRYVLVNVYGPNRDNKAVKFFHSLFNSMTQNEYDTEENIIMVVILIAF